MFDTTQALAKRELLLPSILKDRLIDEEDHFRLMNPLDRCKLAFEEILKEDLPSKKSIRALIESCRNLIQYLTLLEGKDSKGQLELFDSILQLKNQIRASLIAPGTKTLKGPKPNKIKYLNEKDQTLLRRELKSIRENILKNYFHVRLIEDWKIVKALKEHLEAKELKGEFIHEKQFLKQQLRIWERKLEQGKPISIPKWYHLTESEETQKKIVEFHILFMKKRDYPGAFVSSYPAEEFGAFAIVLSNYIEKTSVQEAESKKKIYPKYTFALDLESIKYSDRQEILQGIKQQQPKIWMGFQKGRNTMQDGCNKGTEGIPILKSKRVQDGGVCYYEDTSLSFIYMKGQRLALEEEMKKYARENRITYLRYSEAQALWNFIDEILAFTLPNNFKGKIKQIEHKS